jgi:hypothetical protein
MYKNKKREEVMKSKLLLIAVVLSLVSSSEADEPKSSAAIEAQTAFLDSHFQMLKSMNPKEIGESADIIYNCLDQVFLKWSAGYIAVMKQTPGLNASQIGQLAEFGSKYFKEQEELPNLDLFRPHLTSTVATELEKARILQGIPAYEPGKTKIDDAQINLFDQTMNVCGTFTFIDGVNKALAKVSEDDNTPPNFYTPDPYFVAWQCTPEGGLEPLRIPGIKPPTGLTGPCPVTKNSSPGSVASGVSVNVTVGPLVGKVNRATRPVDYKDYLNRISQQ